MSRRTPAAAVTAALITATVGIGAATAHAAPAGPAPIAYTATIDPVSTTITLGSGTPRVTDGVLTIQAPDGTVVAGTELSFRVDDFVFPIAAEISGRTAVLTPRLDPAAATYQPVALPYEDQAGWRSPYEREQAAWARMASTIGLGVSVGALVGGIGGAAVGCVLGAIAGATVAAATIAGLFGPFLPAAAVGCLGGIAAIGALGTVAGQILIIAPVTIAAAAQYFTTINQPFTPAK
ncbi:hypothetical protein JK358_13295 [Nocardia sp. 2]|uniref:DUF8020 domain-containing protein n=1 Tax=Nocardia acididurans TaxID=2802282 RepID=A0ABS1M5C1_9NOCA|nr:hypothetical protein [Nocardia acididurans]MBL1075370.1 hypothetical protein [Nocardia acididurans]